MWRKWSRPVAWLDGMVEILVSDNREALAASKQLRRALTIRYRDSSVDSNIPGTSLDQGVSSNPAALDLR